jgi:tyrosine-protein phosphatase YwqE
LLPFFKTKPTLKELIPANYVDIHSHLLPGIDDGSKSIDDTELLLRQMRDMGIQHCITTPHIYTNVWDNNETLIQEKLQWTQNELSDKKCYTTLKAGAEYMIDSFFMKRLETGVLLTLKDNYVLVEMSYLHPPMQLFDILFEIQLAGYKPLLAHPERYVFYTKNFKEYERLKKSGCLFQLNLLSCVDYYGEIISKTADKLLKNGMVDYVGSDIHHQNHVDSFSKKVTIKNIAALEQAFNNNLFFLP